MSSKGQIPIPIPIPIAIAIAIRERLGLKPGDVLDFDENSPFLKAMEAVQQEAWDAFHRVTRINSSQKPGILGNFTRMH